MTTQTLPIVFPESFIKKAHHIKGAFQWVCKIESRNIDISIVGGARGLYGDGVNTFEMWDTSQGDDILEGYMSIEEINEHLNTKYNAK